MTTAQSITRPIDEQGPPSTFVIGVHLVLDIGVLLGSSPQLMSAADVEYLLMMNPDTSDRELVTSRVFTHPRDKVFDAFSDAQTLAKWWGPKGFTNTFHSFDFRTGGQWQFTMHSPDGHDFKNESVFKELSSPTRIIIEHVSTPKYLLEITLADRADGTLLSWVQRFETSEMRDKIAKFAGNANEENLDRLAAVLVDK